MTIRSSNFGQFHLHKIYAQNSTRLRLSKIDHFLGIDGFGMTFQGHTRSNKMTKIPRVPNMHMWAHGMFFPVARKRRNRNCDEFGKKEWGLLRGCSNLIQMLLTSKSIFFPRFSYCFIFIVLKFISPIFKIIRFSWSRSFVLDFLHQNFS